MGGIRLTGGLGEGCGWYKANRGLDTRGCGMRLIGGLGEGWWQYKANWGAGGGVWMV